MTPQFESNWPAPNEYMLELGRMMAIWGTLESSMNLAISKLAGYEIPLDERALILVAHSNFQQRLDIISSLCEQVVVGRPSLRDYKAVVTKIKAAQKARNKYAHNAVYTDESTGNVMLSYATARGVLKTNVEVVKIEDIMAATAKIHVAMCAIHTLTTGKLLRPMWEREE